MIDRTQYKLPWLILAQVSCGVFVFLFGCQADFRPFLTSLLVIFFSLIFNFALIIINQYMLPMIHDNYEKSVVIASYVTGGAVFFPD